MIRPRLFSIWLPLALVSACTSPRPGERRSGERLASTTPTPSPRRADASVLDAGMAPEQPSPGPAPKAPPSPRPVCEVRWAPDGKTIAAVDAEHVRVRARGARRWAVELPSPPGFRFVDVSLAARAVLEQGLDGRRRLVSLDDGHPLFPEALAEAPWAQLTEDGTRLVAVHTVEEDPDGSLYVPWFLDLRTGERRQLRFPNVSEAGDDGIIERRRRNAVQILESRVLVAFVDIRRATGPDPTPYVRIEPSWLPTGSGGGGDEDATLRGADVDDDFRTIAIAKAKRSEEDGEVAIEIFGRFRAPAPMASAVGVELVARWVLPPGAFRALRLSPNGGRLVVQGRDRGKAASTVWDTRTGKRLGSVPIAGDCFDFSPDGRVVADERGDDLALIDLP